ncbi:MAG: AraC family transcriptional regulator [Pseudonocardiaceae bacterium]
MNFGDLVTDLGGDPDAVLLAHGVNPALAGDHERFLTYTAVATVIGEAAKELGRPDFGLELARRQSIDILGPIAVIARHAATVADALDGVSRYLHTYSPSIATELRRGAASSEFTFTVTLRQLPHRDRMVELSLGIGLGALRLLVAPDFVPLQVTMQHARAADPEAYEKLFGCPIEFEGTQNCLTVPNSALNTRIHGSDSAARALAEKYLAPIRPDLAVADHVHDLIQRLLPLNQAGLVGIARAMSLHPRVLQRRLAESDTTFEAILDDVRRTSALRLSATGLQVAQIARMLGYSEQSSYTRACKRWFGQSPRQLITGLTSGPSHGPHAQP